jgi:hypothetical protein
MNNKLHIRIRQLSEHDIYEMSVFNAIPIYDRDQILRLFPEDATNLWSALLHHDCTKHSVKQLLGHWANRSVENWMGWHDSANDSSAPDVVSPKLFSIANWDLNSSILFVHKRIEVYKTSWKLFLKYWRDFLHMNDYPIIIKLNEPKFFYFGSTGNTAWGWRPIHSIESDIVWLQP